MDTSTSPGDSTHAKPTSEVFHQGAGDFALISSDRTVFYIPRAVLQLASKVFEGMFETGSACTTETAPILIQASSKHLDIILKYAHPGHTGPDICDVTTLAELLRIAKQYEMDSVRDQLRVWFTKIRLVYGIRTNPITKEEPLAALVVATSFDCVEEARYALGEVSQCDLRQELGAARRYEIPLYLMQQIFTLRASVAAKLMRKVASLSKQIVRACHRDIISGESISVREEASENLTQCLLWELDASQQLHAEPRFSTLKRLVSNAVSRGIARKLDISIVWQMVESWEVEWTERCTFLPDLDDAGSEDPEI